MTVDPEILRAMLFLAFVAGMVVSAVTSWVLDVVSGWRR